MCWRGLPLLTALLSLPLPDAYASLTLAPEQQKQQTLHALLTILLRIAAQQPLLFVMEDLHWVDPSTLELLTLLVDQGPTVRIFVLLTFRPDFSPPWTGRSHLTQVPLPRLPRREVGEMIGQVAHHKPLLPEVVEQVVIKTDGVPLFVEELTKMVLESGLLQEREERYELTGPLPPLAIPTTLHDSLMARLDRLAMVKGLAQLGATLGGAFSYALLQAVTPWDEATLHRGLHQLVEAEFLYQRGLPPQATYLFKLRSTRQQYHQRIAQALEARFPEIGETQPELLAHHYTEAGCVVPALAYWQHAGQQAKARSAHAEALGHLARGLEVLETLPDTAERQRHELEFQLERGLSLIVTKGQAAPEVGQAYERARALCQRIEDPVRLFRVLWGLWHFHIVRAELQIVQEVSAQFLRLAQRCADPAYRLGGYWAVGGGAYCVGAFDVARQHWEQSFALYEDHRLASSVSLYGSDLGVFSLCWAPHAVWHLGYPDQALTLSRRALTLACELEHPYSLALALDYAAMLHQFRREHDAVSQQAETAVTLCAKHGFAYYRAWGIALCGWVRVAQEHREDSLAQLHEGLAALRATGASLRWPYYLVLLADAYGTLGRIDDGLTLLREALTSVHDTGEVWHEAEVHRLRGELLLRQDMPDEQQAETCFHQALATARLQHAKSLELRAAMSLSRLWQRQSKHAEAYNLLAPVYGWFTEGFDTADLQEAKAFLATLG